MIALALDGLRRKLGRNLLTMSGVFIGVLALTLIISLGEGMANVISSTVDSGNNLRQIGLSPGFGNQITDDKEVEIVGDMTDARRDRMRRAALARTRPGTYIGRRAQTIDAAALDSVREIDHVVSVSPIVVERYNARAGEHGKDAAATLGIDTRRGRCKDRLIAGSYLSGHDAREVLVHEYLAYQWGYVTIEELDGLVGRTVTLETIQGGAMGSIPPDILAIARNLDLPSFTDEEREALPKIIDKIIKAFGGGEVVETEPATYELKIVGVVRELEPSDPFNVIEDGNAWQVDLFMPHETAVAMYLSSSFNQELGFGRALVMVDQPENAKSVESALRTRGYSAYSVASVVDTIETTVGAITIIIAFLTSIALIVAALGIVNTMVTSVLERTREIGLWKAVGATNGQVRSVFLLEAALIGLFGGLLGLGLAVLLMIPGEDLAASLIAERATFPLRTGVFQIPAWLPVAGPLLAMVVAMLASLYPAYRASRIDPVKALRHD